MLVFGSKFLSVIVAKWCGLWLHWLHQWSNAVEWGREGGRRIEGGKEVGGRKKNGGRGKKGGRRTEERGGMRRTGRKGGKRGKERGRRATCISHCHVERGSLSLPRIAKHGAAFLLFLPLMLTIIFPPPLAFSHDGCHTLGRPGWRESRERSRERCGVSNYNAIQWNALTCREGRRDQEHRGGSHRGPRTEGHAHPH